MEKHVVRFDIFYNCQTGGKGHRPQGGGANLLFDQIFPETCMKIKKWTGGGCPGALKSKPKRCDPPDPLPTHTDIHTLFKLIHS